MGLFEFMFMSTISNSGKKRRDNNSYSYGSNDYENAYEDGCIDSCEDHDCDCDVDRYDCDDSCDCDW